MLLLAVATSIWFVGDFHTFHYSDDLIHSLNSLYRWTPLSWESDHIGSLLALLVSPIHRPYWNVLAISTLSSLLFLGGLTLWTSLLSSRSKGLVESALWVLLLLPLVLDKHRIFDNASHGSTFGSAFFFAGLFTWSLLKYLEGGRSAGWLLGLFITGFLTIYLSKTVLIPLGVVTLCLLARQAWMAPRTIRSRIELIAPPLLLALALLLYEGLELNAPAVNIYGMSLANIPISLPMLVTNWITHELTTPMLIAVPIALLFIRPAIPLFGYLIAGVLLETLIISSSGWVVNFHLSGYYLTDMTFLLFLTIVLLLGQPIRQFIPQGSYPTLLTIVAVAALVLNTREWNSFTPILPFAAMEQGIAANTPSMVEAGCDILAGDYWKTWPPVLAANDYYFRNHVTDARTGEMRVLAAISLRAAPTERLWRQRLDWPDGRVCGLAGDEAEMRSYMVRYAPDRALFLVNPTEYGGVIAYEIANQHLSELNLDFDSPAPGEGWSYLERTLGGESFVWMKATSSTLFLPLATDHDLSLEFRVIHAMAPDILESLALRVNGEPVPLSHLEDDHGAVIFRASLPGSVLAANRHETVFSFQINRLLIPGLAMPPSDDGRSLGVALDWLRIK